MTSITITINTENAVFEPDPHQEVAVILAELLDKHTATGEFVSGPLFDTNGNKVGEVKIEE